MRSGSPLTAFGLVAPSLIALFLSYVGLDGGRGGFSTAPALVVRALALPGAGPAWLVGAAARLTGCRPPAPDTRWSSSRRNA
ncbi:hypothetical protein [Streptomyces albogriseolus]|uniref:hypothetical protein n=1 Tax=Streptomyces albogriseolus TaxID=1887 RepID=UPI0033A8F494